MKIAIYVLLLTFSITSAKELLAPQTKAPRFLIKSMSGNRVGLRNFTSPKKGVVKPLTLFSFWSLSCIPCRKEMPVLNAYYNEKSADVNLAFINLDTKNEYDGIQQFLNQFGITAPVLLDIYQSTGKKYNVCEGKNCNVPALYGMDSSGTIVFSISGYDESEDLVAKLNSYLRQVKGEAPLTPTNIIATPIPLGKKTTITDSLRLSITHDALVRSPFKDLEKKYNLSKKDIIEILKGSEDILRREWNITTLPSPQASQPTKQ